MSPLTRVVMFLLATVLVVSGCASSGDGDSGSDSSGQQSSKQVELTDQAGRAVTVPEPAARMVVLQHHSLDTIAMLGGQDHVVGVLEDWPSLLGDYMTDVFPGIDDLPTPGTIDDANVEEIAELHPDVVIVAPQFNKDTMAQLEDLGIPVMVVAFRAGGAQEEAQNPTLDDADQAYTDGTEWAVQTLGALTDTSKKADALWTFATDDRAYVTEQLKSVPTQSRPRVFIANEKNMTYGTDKYVSVQLQRAGGINVAVPDVTGYKEVAFEQVLAWNPEVILVQDRYKAVYDDILSNPAWQSVDAVQNDRVYLAPSWTKPWGNPAPDSIALGEMWLAQLLYPDLVEKSYVQQKAEEFYEEFYGVKFTGTV